MEQLPRIWPEDNIPAAYSACARCELSNQRKRIIWGEGTAEAEVMVLLDNPGAREDREGREYVCGTRETLQQGLVQVGIPLDAVYVTYIVKCRPIRAYDKPTARSACNPYLDEQLASHRPALILCLGDVAVRSLLRDDELSVKVLRGKLHEARGIPVIASYHPLAVRRRPNLFPLFIEDCRMVAERVGFQISREITRT